MKQLPLQIALTCLGLVIVLTYLNVVDSPTQVRPTPRPQLTATAAPSLPYVEALVGQPQFINPLLAEYNPVDRDLVALLFDGLTDVRGDGKLVPALAEGWRISQDARTYTFTLRSDVRWHDGQPFTAADVVFTVNLLRSPEFPGPPFLRTTWQQVGVQALDDYTVQMNLLEPLPTFLDSTTIGILPAHRYTNLTTRDLLSHPTNLDPLGTGQFRLETINQQLARLRPNPEYWGEIPQIPSLELRFYPTYQETLAAYEDGTVLGGAVPPQAISTVQNFTDLSLYNAQQAGYTLIFLNLREEAGLPFATEATVRQAMWAGLDLQRLIDTALDGQGIIANSPILAWSWAYDADQPLSHHNITRAASLLDQAGWVDRNGDGRRDNSDGEPFAFTLVTSNHPTKILVANEVARQWGELGLVVTVEIVGPELGTLLRQRLFEAALVELSFFGDPDPYPWWHLTQIEEGQNYAGWRNRQASALLETARQTADFGQRAALYRDFQQLFVAEVPSILLYNPVYSYGVHQRVEGVQLSPLTRPSDRFRNIADWYVSAPTR